MFDLYLEYWFRVWVEIAYVTSFIVRKVLKKTERREIVEIAFLDIWKMQNDGNMLCCGMKLTSVDSTLTAIKPGKKEFLLFMTIIISIIVIFSSSANPQQCIVSLHCFPQSPWAVHQCSTCRLSRYEKILFEMFAKRVKKHSSHSWLILFIIWKQ